MLRKIIILNIALLLGCQSIHSNHGIHNRKKSHHHAAVEAQDSAPMGPIPSFFKLVTPKLEPLSRYGNPPTYKVYGRSYAVLRTARGYKERGLASWYGTKFHRQRTSSGEKYDMYALTAAHKTLPIPTYVRVKNIENGRVAVIRVNDRGPFHSGRIIDLSYGAAVKLGIYPKGTARVEVEAIMPNSSSRTRQQRPQPRQPSHPQQRQYFIQAATYKTQRSAEQLRAKLAHVSSSRVFVVPVKHYWLVRIGPFINKQSAQHVQKLLLTYKLSGQIMKLNRR